MKTIFSWAGRLVVGWWPHFTVFWSKVNWAVTAATPGRVIQRWRVKATTSTVNHSFLASHWVVAIYLQWMALLPMWWPGFLNGKTLGVRWCETGRELLFSERLVYLRSLKITSSVPRAWDFFRGWDELGGRGACDGVVTLFPLGP